MQYSVGDSIKKGGERSSKEHTLCLENRAEATV